MRGDHYHRCRQDNGEDAAPGIALDGDVPAHEIKITFDDAEPKARPGDTCGIMGPEETFEEVLLFFGRDADAPVGDA